MNLSMPRMKCPRLGGSEGNEMDDTPHITDEELEDVLREERENLKEGRIYLILEASEEDETFFSMLCLDTTKNNKDGTSSVCQTLAKGLVHLISESSNDIFDLGQAVLDHESPNKETNVVTFDGLFVEDNVVSLDNYRKDKHTKQTITNPETGAVTVTFSFNDDEPV